MNPAKVFYQIFVRSFCDSNQDGIGDLKGIHSKLDYLQDLGVEGIWLSPIFKSPSYHKYDVTDYYQIDPEYGTLEDLQALVKKAHSLGIQVILDFVLNHTSSLHPWFLDAQKGRDSTYRNFYIWKNREEIKALGLERRKVTADSQERNPWHLMHGGEKYYGFFWREMPDLNLDYPPLKKTLFDCAKYWLNQGIDGFRMDAAKHIFLPHEMFKAPLFWKEFRKEMEAVKPDFYLVGEVWDSMEVIAPFYQGLKANFNFELSYALQDFIKTGTLKKALIKKLLEGYSMYQTYNPNFIDATMLSNHDMNRVASLEGASLAKLKMAASILFTLPGQPYIYYGEELGMKGKKPDENIREAFLWDTRNKDSFRTNWKKPKYNTDSKVSPLSEQQKDAESIYHHYKKLIHLRKTNPALGQVFQPNLEAIHGLDARIFAFKRSHTSGNVSVFHNTSSKPVYFPLAAPQILFGSLENGFLPAYQTLVLAI